MQKNKILKRIDRIIFQAIVMGDNLTADDVLRLGNHARFKKKLFMVGDTCRVSVRKLSNSASIFTVVNYFPVFRDNTDSWFQIEFVMVLFNGVRTGFQWEQVKRGEAATILGQCRDLR